MGAANHKSSKRKKGRSRTASFRRHDKKYAKDIDQILDSLTPEKIEEIAKAEPQMHLPGEGRYQCLTCDRYFMNRNALTDHMKSKQHKRRYQYQCQYKSWLHLDTEAIY
ncbi:hypothetical protein KIPB_003758 [Kipferlia bialata]|uniref:C2H2-type domain-containing protein n=1 Tax=Kipferlia bialata TaxID=797122 RepID=A0A9K3CVZ5_9EUKA|nr:hypothetical protein KIPB_003758 [Kipferlia bialata]|eukprot:g3758.t1